MNLFLTKEYTSQAPSSSVNASGIIYALGNEGEYQKAPGIDTGLYLSRNGGYQWERVLNGSHYFSFNDHASIIVSIENEQTNSIQYSWDQGLNWQPCNFGDLDFQIQEIVSLTNYPNGLQFLVFGYLSNEEGIIMSMDFVGNIPRLCEPHVDYENFRPTLGGQCLLGAARSYERRKRDSTCVVPDYTQTSEVLYSCVCTRQDFQWYVYILFLFFLFFFSKSL